MNEKKSLQIYKSFLLFFLMVLLICSCNKNKFHRLLNKKNKIENLERLKKNLKFKQNNIYPGLEDKELKELLFKKLDKIIDEFKKGVENNYNDKQYQELLKRNIIKLDPFNLKAKYRENICQFFEKIMNAIELLNSKHILNEWLYTYDY